MEKLRLALSNHWQTTVQLIVAIGIATLLLATVLSWAESSQPPRALAAPANQEAGALSNGSVITIGVAADLSGPVPDIGWRQVNSVQLAISQTNTAGGIDIGGTHYTVTLVVADSACDTTQAVTAANELLAAGALAVVGHSCSGASNPAQPLYNAAGVPMISPSSTNPDVTQQGYTTTFRVIGKDGSDGTFMAKYFRQRLGVDVVSTIERSGAFGGAATAAFSDTFVSLGGTITSVHTVTSTDDYTDTLVAIQAENPDAIFYADENADYAGLLSSIAHDLGMGDMIVGWDAVGASFDAYATAAGAAAEGDYAVSYLPGLDDMPGYTAFNAAYQAAVFPNYGDEAHEWGALAYDAAKIIIAAADRADSTDPTAIRDEIAATANYDGVAGTYGGFDAQGDVSPPWVWLKRYESGEWLVLHPAEEIIVGTAAVLSGPYAWLGWQQVNAVQLAISQTNAAGGIDIGGTHYTVTLVVADSAGDPTQAITAAYELLAAGSVAVVGHTCSNASMPAAPIYHAAGVAMVSPSSTRPQLTLEGYTTTFRTIPHDGSAAIKLAEHFANVGLKRTAVLLRTDFWADTLADFYQGRYTGLGGAVVSSRTITATADITPALTAIQAEGVDVIFVADLIGDVAGEVSRVAYNMGMTPTIAWLGISDGYITTQAGTLAAEGDSGATGGRRASDMPGYAAFEAEYVAANFPNEPNPGDYSPSSYDATNIILEAIGRANTLDTLAVRDEIAATADHTGVVGTYQEFDANGDVVPQWARVEVVEDSVWVPAMLQVEIYADQGGTLDLGSTLGQKTTIEIPAGTTTQTLHITYTLIVTMTNAGVPTMTMIGQHAIRLESNVSISSPMTVTVEYDDEDVAEVDESTLAFYTWDGSQWVPVDPCGGYIRDVDNNILKMIICHFSDYVLLGERLHWIYLPVVLKAAP